MFNRYIDPKNDFAFKKIFGSTQNIDILIHFLNDMITFREGGKITEVNFLTPVQEPETAASKTSVVDILCKDEYENTYIVEMQVAKEKGFEKRALFYASKAYTSQMCAGGQFWDLKEIIFLAITNFVMFPDKKNYKSDHVILDRETLEQDLKDFSFTFIELPKFNKGLNDLSNMMEKWCYFFKNAQSEENIEKLANEDIIIDKAMKELKSIARNPAELLIYDQAEKYQAIDRAKMAQKFDEGKEEGEKIGIEKGERAKGIKIAQSMMEKGIDIETIKEVTGVTEEEFDSLSDLMPV